MSQSCFARLFARTSFLLTRLFTSIGWSGISPAQIPYILFLCACWVFGDALLATTAKGASRGFCCNVPSRTLTLRNPLGEKRGWAICFSTQFIQRQHPKAKSTDHGVSPGRNCECCLDRADAAHQL
jgi:hypothetical protein